MPAEVATGEGIGDGRKSAGCTGAAGRGQDWDSRADRRYPCPRGVRALLLVPGCGLDVTTSGGPLADFGVRATLVGEQAVLALRGDLDISGAPELGAYFDTVMASGHLSRALDLLVLDLSELHLMDPSGLTVIAYGASRLTASGGVLTIRAPSAMGTRTLDVTGLGELVALELPGPARDQTGPEQSVAAPGTPVRSEPTSPFHSWREVTATPADDDVVDGALRLAVHLARASVAASNAALTEALSAAAALWGIPLCQHGLRHLL